MSDTHASGCEVHHSGAPFKNHTASVVFFGLVQPDGPNPSGRNQVNDIFKGGLAWDQSLKVRHFS
jgi:hypothetical protein